LAGTNGPIAGEKADLLFDAAREAYRLPFKG
jgi:hypothetical protein